MSSKFALIIGNNEYHDPNLAKLTAPVEDVKDFVKVLRDPAMGGFDEVIEIENGVVSEVQRAIARFFAKKQRDDLLLLYFSGHSVINVQGHLYLALQDTELDLLSGTSIPTSFITQEMDHCRSQRQVLILDCCHSGSFYKGTKSELGSRVGVANAFEGKGYGRVILSSSDSTQFAWEGNRFIGEARRSLFTHFLIEGIETGAADFNMDGWISLDELYDYAYEHVVKETPEQTPGKWSYRDNGDIILAKNPAPPKRAEKLPKELLSAISNPLPAVRKAVLPELDRLLYSEEAEIREAAHEVMHRMQFDDSKKVSDLAKASLESYQIHLASQEAEAQKEIPDVEAPSFEAEPVPDPQAEEKVAVQSWLEEARQQIGEEDVDEAIRTYEKVLDLAPENQEAISGLELAKDKQLKIAVRGLLDKGREDRAAELYEEALISFKAALRLAPDDAGIQKELADCQQKLQAKNAPPVSAPKPPVRETVPKYPVEKPRFEQPTRPVAPARKKKSSPLKWLIPVILIAVVGGGGYFYLQSQGGGNGDAAFEQVAAEAKQEMQAAKSEAARVNAGTLSAEVYAMAQEAEMRAEQAWASESYETASEEFRSAVNHYNQAINDARTAGTETLVPAVEIEENPSSQADVLAEQAQAAQQAMEAAQTAATRADAPSLATTSFNRGKTAAQTGTQALSAGDPESATRAFKEAESAFLLARDEANRKAMETANDLNQIRDMVVRSREDLNNQKQRAENAGAPDLAKGLFDQAQAKEQEGNRLFQKGDKDSFMAAQEAFAAASDGYSNAASAAEKVAQLKKQAESAKSEMLTLKQQVGGTPAERSALSDFKSGETLENDANRQYNSGDYEGAMSTYNRARSQFSQAAETLKQQQAEAALKQQQAAAAQVQAEKEQAAQPSAADAEAAAKQEIQGLINRYKMGMETSDLVVLEPFISVQDVANWKAFFKNARDVKVSIEGQYIQINGTNARVTFGMNMNYFNKSNGQPGKANVPVKWDLKSSNGRWRIIN